MNRRLIHRKRRSPINPNNSTSYYSPNNNKRSNDNKLFHPNHSNYYLNRRRSAPTYLRRRQKLVTSKNNNNNNIQPIKLFKSSSSSSSTTTSFLLKRKKKHKRKNNLTFVNNNFSIKRSRRIPLYQAPKTLKFKNRNPSPRRVIEGKETIPTWFYLNRNKYKIKCVRNRSMVPQDTTKRHFLFDNHKTLSERRAKMKEIGKEDGVKPPKIRLFKEPKGKFNYSHPRFQYRKFLNTKTFNDERFNESFDRCWMMKKKKENRRRLERREYDEEENFEEDFEDEDLKKEFVVLVNND